MQSPDIDITNLQIVSLSDHSLLINFGNRIDAETNDRVLSLHQHLMQDGFEGYVESVPAYASLAVFYDVLKISSKGMASAFDFVKKELEILLEKEHAFVTPTHDLISIPVCYGGEFGPDIARVAAQHQISEEEVIRLHSSTIYRVYMIGFTPGFAYMGTVADKLITPRKEHPRILVHAGSVGIAGIQTGVYPMDSPGGWQIIGKTFLHLFDKNKPQPCLLKAGDRVQFVAISKNEFDSNYGI